MRGSYQIAAPYWDFKMLAIGEIVSAARVRIRFQDAWDSDSANTNEGEDSSIRSEDPSFWKDHNVQEKLFKVAGVHMVENCARLQHLYACVWSRSKKLAATNMNRASSRSHSIFTYVIKKGKTEEKTKDKEEKDKEKVKDNGTSLDALLLRLPGCVSRDLLDQLTVEFCYVNSKSNRRKLVLDLFNVPRTSLELLPYYSRLVATLSIC